MTSLYLRFQARWEGILASFSRARTAGAARNPTRIRPNLSVNVRPDMPVRCVRSTRDHFASDPTSFASTEAAVARTVMETAPTASARRVSLVCQLQIQSYCSRYTH